MAQSTDIRRLEKALSSGKNPEAYLYLARHYRREKRFRRALDICQRGVASDPRPAEGALLHARLLTDLGRYIEALRVLERLIEGYGPSLKARLLKLECLVRLRYLDEAWELYSGLVNEAPMDPEVQYFGKRLGTLQRQITGRSSERRPRQPAQPSRLPLTSRRDMLDGILEEIRPLSRVQSCAVIPTGGGTPALEGKPEHALAGFEVHREVASACRDLDFGSVHWGVVETPHAQLIVLVRGENLVSLSIEPTSQLGKILHRLLLCVGRLVPGTAEETSSMRQTGADL